MGERRHTADDVFAAAVPDDLDPTDPSQRLQLLAHLDQLAREWVWAQWRTGPRPRAIEFAVSHWLITSDSSKVEEFQPAHDCVACRAGNDQSKAYLKANPGRYVAMANLRYTEIWAE